MYSHVKKTGDIKRFIILDESLIAKGIRRITGVTGDEALIAQNSAQEMQNKVEELKKIPLAQLESSLKVIGKELENIVLPLISRNALKLQFQQLKKEFDCSDKLRKAEEVKEVVEMVNLYFENNRDNDEVYVNLLPTSSSKALSQATSTVKGLETKSCFLFAIDDTKILMQCVVSKEHAKKGLKASEWAGEVCSFLGGKCGGKDDAAQGSGVNIEKIDEALQLAISLTKILKL